MNARMLERIKADGSSGCKSEGGLKGITWAYSSMPGGNHLFAGKTRRNDLAIKYENLPNFIQAEIRKRESPEEYDVGADMANLAAAAPKSYSFINDVGASSATYVCQDGVENQSEAFVFVP
jgi:hypothetical protein